MRIKNTLKEIQYINFKNKLLSNSEVNINLNYINSLK